MFSVGSDPGSQDHVPTALAPEVVRDGGAQELDERPWREMFDHGDNAAKRARSNYFMLRNEPLKRESYQGKSDVNEAMYRARLLSKVGVNACCKRGCCEQLLAQDPIDFNRYCERTHRLIHAPLQEKGRFVYLELLTLAKQVQAPDGSVELRVYPRDNRSEPYLR